MVDTSVVAPNFTRASVRGSEASLAKVPVDIAIRWQLARSSIGISVTTLTTAPIVGDDQVLQSLERRRLEMRSESVCVVFRGGVVLVSRENVRTIHRTTEGSDVFGSPEKRGQGVAKVAVADCGRGESQEDGRDRNEHCEEKWTMIEMALMGPSPLGV